jgi:hypothetical protein
MITHVTQSDFIDTFRYSHTYKNNFSYDALIALFDYLVDLEQDTGEQINFDMIGLCCEYSEYSNIEEFITDYQDYEHIKNWDANVAYDNLILALREETEVIEFEGKTNKVNPISNCYSLKATPDKSFIIRAF